MPVVIVNSPRCYQTLRCNNNTKAWENIAVAGSLVPDN